MYIKENVEKYYTMEIKNLRILESFKRSTNFKVEVREDPKIERLKMSGIKKFEHL